MTAKSSNAQSQQSPPPPSDNSTALWHGLGLFGESYLLFSIGTLRPLWEALYPLCFSNEDADPATSCPHPYLTYNSLSYSVPEWKFVDCEYHGGGCCVLASLLLAGNFNNIDDNNNNEDSGRPDVLFMVMSASLFIFGIGVGGEYPLSASLASERAMAAMKERRRLEEQQERGGNRSRTNMSSSLAVTESMSSRLLTTANYDGNSNKVKGSSSNDHHSWQTTTSRSANMAQIEEYNVTQQSQSSTNNSNNSNNATNNTTSSSKTMARGREVSKISVIERTDGLSVLYNKRPPH
eukprot:scaffold8027_cov145-Skeletonema_marinoi.AAC.4